MSSLRTTVLAGWAALLAPAAACAPHAPPCDLVGESAHFRLFVDRALTVFPPGLDGSNGLVALETEWSDVQTMLEMPDGKIDYYWLAPGNIPAACGGSDRLGCTWEDRMEIDASTLPNAHELNHAYLYLRTHRRAIPFLAEGFAEAIGCDYDPPTVIPGDPRPEVVAELPTSSDLYAEGALFMRYLIRTQGVDEVVRYYEQSPDRRDPALFATNFEAFWKMRFDDVWAAVHTIPPGVAREDSKICPCTLPALPTTGPVTHDPARALYWTLPDVGDDSIAMTAGPGQGVHIRDCAGLALSITGKAVLAHLGAAGSGRYVLPPVISATVDRYVSDDCSGAAVYHLPADFLVGIFPLTVGLLVPTSADLSAYVAVDFPVSTHLDPSGEFREICDRCPADGGACQTAAAASMMPVQGTVYGRLQVFPRAIDVPPFVWTAELGLAP